MKIMQVNCVYNQGSTGKVVYDIHKEVMRLNFESIVCYGNGEKVNEINIYKTTSEIFTKFNALRNRVTGLQYNGSYKATNKLISIIEKEKPNVVHLHCLNGHFVNIYKLLNYLKTHFIPTVLTLHAEFMYTGGCGHALACEKWKTGCSNCPQLWNATRSYFLDRTGTAWKMMKDSFDGFRCLKIISVSKWLQERAKQSPILKKHDFQVIHNGIDTKEIFCSTSFEHLRIKHKIKDEKVLLHVTASFSMNEGDIKGGRYIVRLAEMLKDKNIVIIVVGAKDSTAVLPGNILNIGRICDQKELATYYSMADLTILTSERETFSMVCAESLACGTPVVGFCSGAPETISIEAYSEFVEYGNMHKLVQAIERWINKKGLYRREIEKIAKEKYSREKMCRKYIDVYNELIENKPRT